MYNPTYRAGRNPARNHAYTGSTKTGGFGAHASTAPQAIKWLKGDRTLRHPVEAVDIVAISGRNITEVIDSPSILPWFKIKLVVGEERIGYSNVMTKKYGYIVTMLNAVYYTSNGWMLTDYRVKPMSWQDRADSPAIVNYLTLGDREYLAEQVGTLLNRMVQVTD